MGWVGEWTHPLKTGALGELLEGQPLGFAQFEESPDFCGIVTGSSHAHHPAEISAAVQVGVTRRLPASLCYCPCCPSSS